MAVGPRKTNHFSIMGLRYSLVSLGNLRVKITSVNLSRIDNTELLLDLQDELCDENVCIIVFGRNWNIFRYREGLGGLTVIVINTTRPEKRSAASIRIPCSKTVVHPFVEKFRQMPVASGIACCCA